MTFDELQDKWQSGQNSGELKIDADMLLKEVQRNKRSFECAIFYRDFIEIVVGISAIVFFEYFGIKYRLWAVHVTVLSVAFVVVFFLVDRIMSNKKQPKCNDTLTDCIKSSLKQVEHQIWLLKNVLWWYLLPPTIGICFFVSWCGFSVPRAIGLAESGKYLVFLFVYLISVFLFDWGIYWLNQRAVRKELMPRKEELEALWHSLED